jgi:hypothetical protein
MDNIISWATRHGYVIQSIIVCGKCVTDTVIKPLDEAKTEQIGMPEEIVQGQLGEVAEGYRNVFKQWAFVRDPDVRIHAMQDFPPYTCFDGATGLSLYLKWLTCERSRRLSEDLVTL